MHCERGRVEEAVEQFRLVLATRERVLGFENIDTNKTSHDLVFRLASTLIRRVSAFTSTYIGIPRKKLGDLGLDTRDTILVLACCLEELSQLDEASREREDRSVESGDVLEVRRRLARCLFAIDEHEEAV